MAPLGHNRLTRMQKILESKNKNQIKNKMKAKTKMRFYFHFCFCFYFCFHFRFCFCFHFHFHFCCCFHFRFCLCIYFRFCFSLLFLVFILKFYYGTSRPQWKTNNSKYKTVKLKLLCYGFKYLYTDQQTVSLFFDVSQLKKQGK